MENKKKKVYDAPQLTVVSFKTERGFAISSAILIESDRLFLFESSDPYVTQYDEDASWADYGWNN